MEPKLKFTSKGNWLLWVHRRTTIFTNFELNHERLGHVNSKYLTAVPNLVSMVKQVRPKDFFCGGCIYGKVQYSSLFKDDYSSCKFVRFLKHKNEVLGCFEQVVNMYKNKFGYNEQRLRVDNGSFNMAFIHSYKFMHVFSQTLSTYSCNILQDAMLMKSS
ncbi:hypothetical protein PR048_001497 [Dryococelus australis]|uniref:GAG-pre-integrase domain-containing protein n=1 Tax=Dryococelus australis TaxID=614101 RepID=A0ABQ9IIX9_9NEOP|nr:hypothetical protein PR048_001497 [Dryococelus australis]